MPLMWKSPIKIRMKLKAKSRMKVPFNKWYYTIICTPKRVQPNCDLDWYHFFVGCIVFGWHFHLPFCSQVINKAQKKMIFNIFFLRKRKKEKEHQAVRREEDLNPVYGFYYFANGQQIDDNNAEATDENQYYESWKLIFNTFEHHARVKPLKLYDLTKTMTNYFSVSSQYRKPIEASSVCIAGWTSSCIKNLQCPSKFSFFLIFPNHASYYYPRSTKS